MSITAAFDVETATRAYLATLSGAARAKSDAYFEGGYLLVLWNAVVGIGVAWGLLRFGVAARLSGWSRRVTRGHFAGGVVLWTVAFFALTTMLVLPWSIYTDFIREH